MTGTMRSRKAKVAQAVALAAVSWAAVIAASVPAAHASPGPPVPDADHLLGLYGDPAAAAPFWRQQEFSDCGEMAVADVVGQMTGREPTEQQVDAVASRLPSTMGSGPIWAPPGNTYIKDLPVLFAYYWIKSEFVRTTVD